MRFVTGYGGSASFPLKMSDGYAFPDASIAEVHEETQRIIRDQIDYAVAAEQRGFDQVFFTEHHSQITGAEISPNPLLSQMYVAAETDEIRLMQLANILPWHEPLRLAEQAAMLDVMSDGRLEFGIGRGFFYLEAEPLGQYWGGGLQGHDEVNRGTFEEKYEIIKRAWTEDLFSYRGRFHEVPPSYVSHDYPQHREYLGSEVTDHEWEDLVETTADGPPHLKSMATFPQPLQDPHPQIWQPTLSERSIKFAARNGINASVPLGSYDQVENTIEIYHEEAERAGWPDHRPEYDGEPFKKGWDEERQRGVLAQKSVFNTEIADEETFERWKRSREATASRFASEGTMSLEAARERFSVEKSTAIYGDTEQIIEDICKTKERCGYEDFTISVRFEGPGVELEEGLAQMEAFSSDVMPYLREEYSTS